MTGVRPEDARSFYEEDEDPAKVFAIFDAAEKGRTGPRSQPPNPRWVVKLRNGIAALLRRTARAIESADPPSYGQHAGSGVWRVLHSRRRVR